MKQMILADARHEGMGMKAGACACQANVSIRLERLVTCRVSVCEPMES